MTWVWVYLLSYGADLMGNDCIGDGNLDGDY